MPKAVFLPFEQEIGDLQNQIEALENQELETKKSERTKIAALEREQARRTAQIYKHLTPWQVSLVARHPNRPYTLDYINAIFEDFNELHGDRMFADDPAIVGGLARLGDHSVVVVGTQKGRDARSRVYHNFGMARPEGYRKALRLFKLAEKFNLPVFTFVDTPGAYPGIGAEERNQSEAIGRNIFELAKLRVPVISTVIGEGGSGGALAIAVADCILMLQYSTYSVISPEGCASILWKDAGKAEQAADALQLTADKLYELGLVDKVLSEPLGGAHRDPRLMAATLKKALVDEMGKLLTLTTDELIDRRLERLMSFGRYTIVDGTEAPAAVPAPAVDEAKVVNAAPAAKAKKPAKTTAAKKPAAKKATGKKSAAAKPAAAKTRTVKKAAAKKAEPVKTAAKETAAPAATKKPRTTARKRVVKAKTTAKA